MKYQLLSILASATVAQAHSIFQQVSVNGVLQGELIGMRAPDSNNPVTDVTQSYMSCNTGLTHLSASIITVPVGATVGAWWEHVIGGPQFAGDPDNPIASTHKTGPIMVYLAAVTNAATTGTTGLKWFKIAQETLNNGIWGVDSVNRGAGWWNFTMPTCIPSGNYLMRVEILALHNAYAQNGAQFYFECAQISITGGGSANPATVSFPGAYSATDPGILINIYDSSGNPTNSGKPYTAPGPAPLVCGSSGSSSSAPSTSNTSSKPASSTSTASSSPTTISTTLKTTTTSATTTTTTTPSSTVPPTTTSSVPTVNEWGQCGGLTWTGPTVCAAPYTCVVENAYFSQCMSA